MTESRGLEHSGGESASSDWRRWLPLASAVVIIVLAAFLRFHRLGLQSFWNDEGNSARLAERSIALIVEGAAGDIHPPGYYLALHYWREIFGSSEFALRSMSALDGILLVVVTIVLARLAGGRRWPPALIAGLLVAVSPSLIYYSQEVRMYAAMALLAVFLTLLLIAWLRKGGGLSWEIWGYALVSSLGLYFHYFFAVVIVCHGLAVLLILTIGLASREEYRASARPALLWISALVLSLLLFAPWLPAAARQLQGRAGESARIGPFINDLTAFLLGSSGSGPMAYLMAAVALLTILAAILSRNAGSAALIVLVGLVLIPPIALYLAGAGQEKFFKFVLISIPAIMIVIAFGVDALTERLSGRWGRTVGMIAALVLLAPLLFGAGSTLNADYYDESQWRPDYRGMAAIVESDVGHESAVVLDAPNQWEVFTYYFTDTERVFPMPIGQPSPEQIGAQLAQIAKRYERIYALFWGEGERDPDHLVEQWLDQNTLSVSDQWVGDIRFVIYAVPESDIMEMENEVGVHLGGSIELNGYTVGGNSYGAGDLLQLALFWKSSATPAADYKVFVHLYGADGQIVAQHDNEPVAGSRPTSSWSSGETIVDNYGLLIPPDVVAGDYWLRVGMYDPADPSTRLQVEGAEAADGLIELESIEIE